LALVNTRQGKEGGKEGKEEESTGKTGFSFPFFAVHRGRVEKRELLKKLREKGEQETRITSRDLIAQVCTASTAMERKGGGREERKKKEEGPERRMPIDAGPVNSEKKRDGKVVAGKTAVNYDPLFLPSGKRRRREGRRVESFTLLAEEEKEESSPAPSAGGI